MAANPESILDSVKQVLGLDAAYTAFDIDVIMHINMAFGKLQEAGVGSDTGFIISDNSTLWSQYCSGLTYLGMVKSYITMAVKLAFDPPATGFGTQAIKEQLEELIWRINVAVEHETPPSNPFEIAPEDETVVELKSGVMQSFFAPKTVTLEYAPVVTPDASAGNVFYLTLAGPCQLNAPINGVNAQHITVMLSADSTAVTWGSGWNFGDAGVPTLSADKTDVISAVYREPVAEWYAGVTVGF